MKLLGIVLGLVAFVLIRLLLSLSTANRSAPSRRLLPLVELVVLLGLVGGVVGLLAGPTGGRSVGLLVALGLLAAAAFGVGRDYVAGVALRAEGAVALGDRLRLGDQEGSVTHLGTFRATLRTAEGRLLVPYRRLAGAELTRLPPRAQEAGHSFDLQWSGRAGLAEVTELVRRTVLLDAGAAAGRAPEIRATGPASLRVRVVALDPATAFDIEGRVRRALAADVGVASVGAGGDGSGDATDARDVPGPLAR